MKIRIRKQTGFGLIGLIVTMVLGASAVVGIIVLCKRCHDAAELVRKAQADKLADIGETNDIYLTRIPVRWYEPIDSEIEINTREELIDYAESIKTWQVQVRTTLNEPWVDTDIVFACREPVLYEVLYDLVATIAIQDNPAGGTCFYRGKAIPNETEAD